jgi:hypothetical protein
METKKVNTLLQYGLLSAVISLLLFVVLYMGGIKLFTSPLAYAAFLVPIIFAVLACVKEKKQRGGYLDFGKALQIAFAVFVISSLVTTIANYVVLNFVDNEFRDALQQYSMEQTEKWMKKFGAPQDQIEKALKDTAEKNPFTAGKLALGFAFYCFLWFIFSLIIALIVRKKRPENEMPNSI